MPLLGTRKLRALTSRDINRFITDVAAGRTAVDVKTARGRAIVKGGPGTAQRTAGLLGGMLSYAVKQGILDSNPARGVERRFSDRRKVRVLSSDELQRLGQALSRAGVDEKNRESPITVALVVFFALTGFRKGEALWLRRSDIDERHGAIRLQDSKAGPQVRAVGRAALELLKSTLAMTDTDLVFEGTKPGVPFIGIDKAFKRLCVRAQIKDASLHTLRHSFATIASEIGCNEFTIAALLGHRAGSITSRYVHVDRALVAAADRVSSEILARLEGAGEKGEIIELAAFRQRPVSF